MKHFSRTLLAASSLWMTTVLLPGMNAVMAEDWPNFRGPNHDGTSSEQITSTWPLQLLWTKDVGLGYSETVTSNGFAYTWGCKDGSNVVYCLDPATGNEIWRGGYQWIGHSMWPGSHDGPRATLTLDNGKIYAIDSESFLHVLDQATGTELWNKDVNAELGFKCWNNERGESSSPWIEGNVILLPFGPSGSAISKVNGSKVWGAPGSDFSACWASVIAYNSGPDRIAAVQNGACYGVKISTGEIIWSFPNPSADGFSCTDLIIYSNKVWWSSSYYAGTICRAYGLGTGTLSQVATGPIGSGCTPNILYNGHIYGLNKGGRSADVPNPLMCMDASSGALNWSGVDWDECGGAIMCGDKILLATAAGSFPSVRSDIVLIDSTPSAYTELHRQMLWNSGGGSGNNYRPSIANGKLYVRHFPGTLVCYNATGTSVAPTITSATNASGVVNQSFSYQITATGSATNYNATGLPTGLSVNTTSGLINGTPPQVGTNTVALSAIGAGGTGTANLTIRITAPALPVITSPTTASGTVGQAFTYQITASGGPTNYTATGLPSGLGVNAISGLISGTPSVSGTSPVTISAVNSVGSGSTTLTITISGSQAIFRINCGGPTVSPFEADAFYSGGGTYTAGNAIDLTGLVNPAPMSVYQSQRYTSALGYDFTGLTPGGTYKVRLHLSEIAFSSAGQRIFDISINSVKVCTNLDIFAETGAIYKGLIKEYTVSAAAGGQISIWGNASVNNAAFSGIEIWSGSGGGGGVQPPTISAMRPTGNKPELGWTSTSGVTYRVYKSTNLLAGWIVTPLTNIPGDGTTKIFTDPSATQPAAFYRLTAQ